MNILTLAFWLLLPQLVGFAGSAATIPSITGWYSSLIKPSFNPPNWIFAPVWTSLFLLMGISSYLVFKQKITSPAIVFYLLQLLLNFLWSYFFFGLHQPLLALVDIILLWLLILATIISFYRLFPAAGLLLIPYLFWVSFASILNLYIVKLN